MKKNVMMRLASFLLVAVLISTSAISGTYAKYVTSDTGSDKARVAKWGVTVEIEDTSNFSKEYQTHDSDAKADGVAVSVLTTGAMNIVAPGTSSEDVDGDFTFKIAGTPEVATKVDIEMKVNHDIYLGADTYDDPTTKDVDSFEVAKTYYPVVFTLKNSKDETVAEGNLAEIAKEFNAESAYHAANVAIDETYTLSWAWDFDDNGVGTNDAADTLLGNLAANEGYGIREGIDYDVSLDYEVKITVTQVD